MKKKLNEYFKLVEKSKIVPDPTDQSVVRAELKDVNRTIKKLSNSLTNPEASIEEVMEQIKVLRKKQVELNTAIKKSGGVDRTSVKKRIVEIRKEILGKKHTDTWEEIVEYFDDNPIALTALMHQTNYDQKDSVRTLKTLPFRGRTSGPYGTRYFYKVSLQNGEEREFTSVRKIILSLDQYNKDFRSLALTFDALQRFVERGISMNSLTVKNVKRFAREEKKA